MPFTLTGLCEFREEIRKSRFITLAAPITSAQEAQAFIEQHSDLNATHNCWAWKLADQYRSNDDGEPGGTAGRPILAAIEAQGFDQVVVLVIRWYGGIQLGTGGLARAYGGGANKCLQTAERIELISRVPLSCDCGFRTEPGQVAGRRTRRAGAGGTLHRQRRGAATGPGRSTHRHPAKPACRPEPGAYPAATLKLLMLFAERPEPRRQRKLCMSTPKTALIIGASRGLGLGLVKQLLKDGWDVTATVRDPNKADALKAVGPVQIEKLDMDDQQAVIALSQRLKERTFDLLFVNAGVKGPANQEPGHATLAEVGQLFFTNAVAPINLAQRFVGQIRKDSGVLAFMSSVLGSVTIPDGSELALYKASKAALNSMTNSFITQLGEQK